MTKDEITEWQKKIIPLAKVRFGTHAHICPDCQAIWECYLVTHCRRPDKFICVDCASKDEL
jgi:hypothetical protein